MPDSGAVVVEPDLLLRWLVECYAAVGYAQEHAFVLGVVTNRLAQVLGAAHVIPRIAAELEGLAGGVSHASRHDILIMRDALDEGVCSAALEGWACIGVVTKQWGDALVSFLPQLVESQVCSISLRHGPKGSFIYSAAPPFEEDQASVVEVPADSAGLVATDSESLSGLVRALGIPLHERQITRGDVQVLLIEPERQNTAWSLARLAHDRLCRNSQAVRVQAPASTQAIPLSAALRELVKSIAKERDVFDPLSGLVRTL